MRDALRARLQRLLARGGPITAADADALRWLLDAEARQAQLVADLAAVYTLPEDQAALLALVQRARDLRPPGPAAASPMTS